MNDQTDNQDVTEEPVAADSTETTAPAPTVEAGTPEAKGKKEKKEKKKGKKKKDKKGKKGK